MLSYGRQSISEEDIEAVVRALRSDFLTCGPEVEAFEKEFAAFIGAKHAVAVCNATAALHLSMRVLGIGPGDRVVTSPNTFLASANAAAYAGATPDFCDIDPVFHNLDPAALEEGWKPDIKAVVAVDYAGVPCNMPEIARIARKHGAYVIEDACHAVGGKFVAEGKTWRIGAHPWADITVFSFHPVKTMTTGEGGMLVTDNDAWAAQARLLRGHGVTRASEEFVGLASAPTQVCSKPSPLRSGSSSESPLSEVGPWYYEMQELGYNYRITDLQCALGRSQLARLPEFIARRQEIAALYNEAFRNLPHLVPPSYAAVSSTDNGFSFQLPDLSLHLYTVQIDFPRIGKTRTEVMQALREQGIGTQVLYIPVYLQPWYQRTFGYSSGMCLGAEYFYERALSLPLHPNITLTNVEEVIAAVKKSCL